MNTFTKVIGGAKDGWNKISTKKKIAFIALLTGMVLIACVFSYFLKKVEYVALFNNLALEDAGAIAEDLEIKKIAYKLENGGGRLLIDKNYLDKYRLQLAMSGMMPGNSSGFEIFDDTGLMVTDEDRRIMYQRALTGELQRSIASLSAINSAKVHLVMPEKSIFESKEKEASASIILDIRPSYKVTEDTINGIAALVSGAVDNLPEKNIQVIDTKGNLLSGFLQKSGDWSTGGLLSQYKRMQNEFEESIGSNLYNLLAGVFGRDKIKVSVYADLDFDSEETTTTTFFDPVVRSEQISAAGEGFGVTQAEGSNINDNLSTVIEDSNSDTGTYNRTVNNELSTETKTIIKAPGKIKKLTASVLYDGILSEENTRKIQNIVASTIGYDIDRGDVISIEGFVFDKSHEEDWIEPVIDEAIGGKMNQKLSEYIKYIVYGLAGIFGFVLLILLMRMALIKKSRSVRMAALEGAATAPINTLDIMDEIEVKVDDKKIKAQKYARENPEVAAELIKSWLKSS